jgi:hypothetical protein
MPIECNLSIINTQRERESLPNTVGILSRRNQSSTQFFSQGIGCDLHRPERLAYSPVDSLPQYYTDSSLWVPYIHMRHRYYYIGTNSTDFLLSHSRHPSFLSANLPPTFPNKICNFYQLQNWQRKPFGKIIHRRVLTGKLNVTEGSV